jgi:asparagine synthase (glutamine-hydrolysing)
MCGFVSFVNFTKEINYNKFLNDTKSFIHRGPDQNKFLKKKNYVINFRRLKIIDLSNNASQPFEDKYNKITLIFNGEIYNYLELKNELKKYKYFFNTNSDTEVILKSYLKWDLKFINKLRGMFSIIIFDERKDKVFFFRDRLGQKPLFYSFFEGGIIFSSEIKDILSIKKKAEFNSETIKKYLFRGWSDDGTNTFFKDIKILKPGHFGFFSKKKFIIKKYWDLTFSNRNNYNSEEFKELFEENMKLHLRSDVPVAFTLSGGIDSTSIVASSLKFKLKQYQTYSVSSDFKNINDEKEIIKTFVKKYNINHKFIGINFENKKDILEEYLKFQDEPVNHISFLYQYLIRKEVKKDGFKVLLNGEGGDEVFGGYVRMFEPYLIENFIRKGINIPYELKVNFQKISGIKFNYYLKKIQKNYNSEFKKDNDIEDTSIFKFTKKGMFLDETLKHKNFINLKSKNIFKNYLKSYLLRRDLPHILRQEDRSSMSQSIENRTPLIDHKLIEYMFSIKSENFMKNGLTKYVLRNYISNSFKNKNIINRKIGRPGSSQIIFNKVYKEKFIDLINSKNILQDYLDKKKILKSLEKNNLDKYDGLNFRMLNILVWEKMFNLV